LEDEEEGRRWRASRGRRRQRRTAFAAADCRGGRATLLMGGLLVGGLCDLIPFCIPLETS
jgi:hypothetical protein